MTTQERDILTTYVVLSSIISALLLILLLPSIADAQIIQPAERIINELPGNFNSLTFIVIVSLLWRIKPCKRQ